MQGEPEGICNSKPMPMEGQTHSEAQAGQMAQFHSEHMRKETERAQDYARIREYRPSWPGPTRGKVV